MKVEDIKNGYCTQFLINKNEGASAEKMRAFAESNGDSVVCIEDDDVINLHVHTADPGKILSEAIKYGYLTNFKIENMHEQFLARQKQGKSLEKQLPPRRSPTRPPSSSMLPSILTASTVSLPWPPVRAEGCLHRSGSRRCGLRWPDHEPRHRGHPRCGPKRPG